MVDPKQVDLAARVGTGPRPALRRLGEQMRAEPLHVLVRRVAAAGAKQERRLIARRADEHRDVDPGGRLIERRGGQHIVVERRQRRAPGSLPLALAQERLVAGDDIRGPCPPG